MARNPTRAQTSRTRSSSKTRVETAPLATSRLKLPPWPELAIWLGLALSILVVYAQTGQFDFVNYDDPEYVTENVHVQDGLSLATIKWAFSAVVAGNWMPLTLLSHSLDYQLFGMHSGAHHMVNVLFHMLAAILLFVCLRRAVPARAGYWPSAFVAFMFAIHPLHVESVAWVSERKDVLFACFWFLALYAYIRYTERETLRGYLLVVVLFCLGLMSKPMMVTFPFALLLFDFWPLRRTWSRKVVLEKIPMIALSAATSAVTFLVQGEAVQEAIPFPFRVRSAIGSYAAYVGKMFWPSGLAVFYPYHKVEIWEAVVVAAAIVGISAVLVAARRNRPYLLTGWLWYLGTLVPVIGLVQAGSQAMADRYTYIPAIGISIMLAWGAAEFIARQPRFKTAVAVLAVLSCGASMVVARNQVGYWLNGETLFKRAIQVTKDNYVALSNLGIYLGRNGRGAEAIPYLEQVLKLIPGDSQIHNSLGILLANTPGRQDEAIAHFETAVRIHPDYLAAQYNLGMALSQIPGREAEAIRHFEVVQKMQPSPAVAEMIQRLRR